MRAIVHAAAAAAVLAAAFPSLAAPLQVTIDHSTRLAVAGSASAVVVGNPAIADVTVVDSHTLFVSGRSYGATDVVVLDPTGRTLYEGEINVAGPSQGHVAVYRGGDRTDLACAPGCQVSVRSAGGKPAGGEAGVAPAAASSAATSAGSLGGAGPVARALTPS